MKLCVKCGETKEEIVFRKKGKGLQSYCDQCLYAYQMRRWTNRKIQAITYKGGQCADCGYANNYCALDFHHTDPTKKVYDWNKLRLRTLKVINEELDKCVLLCRNCHAERHNPHGKMVRIPGIEPGSGT